MHRLATVCARAGSKGVPGKNLRPLAGKPLVSWTVELALGSGLFDAVAVDSDSSEILEIAERSGVDYAIRRPDELAGDRVGKLPAIRHAVEEAERRAGETFDVVVDLDVTSPLRSVDDVVGAIEMLEIGGAGNVITGCASRRSPYFNLVEVSEHGNVAPVMAGNRFLRRQDVPMCFDMNASIYVWWRDRFMSDPYVFDEGTRLYEMPQERSFDIDEPLDFELVEWLMLKHLDRGETCTT